jgi:hypothetical protein
MPSTQTGHSVLGGSVVSECERKSVWAAMKVSRREEGGAKLDMLEMCCGIVWDIGYVSQVRDATSTAPGC